MIIIVFSPVFTAKNTFSWQSNNSATNSHPIMLNNLNIEIFDVFDSTESFYKYRAAKLVNTLHITTKTYVVNRELLFLTDSVITAERIMESANNLRETGIFQWVTISMDTLSNSNADLTVRVKDHFSSQIMTSLSVSGGNVRTGFGVKDINFIGRGYSFSIEAEKRKDDRDFFLAKFVNPRLLGSRFVNTVEFLKYDEAELQFFKLDRPFYSQETHWDMAGGYLKSTGKQFRYFTQNEYTKNNQWLRQTWMSYGRYFGDNTRLRLGFRYFHQNEQLSGPDIPDGRLDWKSRRVSLSIGGIRRTISVSRNIDRSDFEEDIHSGFLINAGIGFDFPALGADSRREAFSGRALFSRLVTDNEHVFFEVGHSRLQQHHNTVEKATTTRLSFSSTRFRYHTIAAKIEFTAIDSRRPFVQVFLGDNTGLRGYSTREFIGNRRLLFNLEDRIFSNITLWFVRLGGTLFFDSGKVWGDGAEFDSTDWHSSIGFGLRLGDPKSSTGIIRVDTAYNLDRKRFSSLSVSKGSYFRVLYPIAF